MFQVHFHAYASPEYLKRFGTPRSPEDLDNHRIVVLGGATPNYLQNVRWLLGAGRNGKDPRTPWLIINNVLGLMRACQRGVGIAMLPVAAVFVLFAWMARDSPKRTAPTTLRAYGAVLKEHDTLWLSLLYSLTFGGFVGFASFLTTFFHEQYQVSRVTAGDFTTLVVVSGSLLRPVGGWLADRVGGYRLLVVLLASASVCIRVRADTAATAISRPARSARRLPF